MSSMGHNPSEIVLSHSRRMWDETALSRRAFALRLADHYPPYLERAALLHDADEYQRFEDSLRRQVERLERGRVRFPLDLLPHWLEAMDDPYRTQCRRDLGLVVDQGRIAVVRKAAGIIFAFAEADHD